MEHTRPLLSFKKRKLHPYSMQNRHAQKFYCITVSTSILVARNTNGSSITPTKKIIYV
jgi:hypothetical protein